VSGKNVLVVSVHPDDEALGCAGTILRHVADGDSVHWLIVTAMTESGGWNGEAVAKRREEIETVRRSFGFSKGFELGHTPARI